MKAKVIIVLVLFVFVWNHSNAQLDQNPYYPMYKWLGEWNMIELDRMADPMDYTSFWSRHIRVNFELLEDKTTVLSSRYYCLNKSIQDEVWTEVYVPSAYESNGMCKQGTIEITYPTSGREVATITGFSGKHIVTRKIHWHTQDSVELRVGENRYILSRVKEESKLPLPKTLEEIGQHLDKTFKKLSDGPFDFADQFISLENLHCFTSSYVEPLDFFMTKEKIPTTALERFRLAMHIQYFDFVPPENNHYYISWPATIYLGHFTTPIGDNDLNNKTPFHQVDYHFGYKGKEYHIKALYFHLKEAYHLVAIKSAIYYE